MASIEQAIRAMLTANFTANVVPDERITHGYRLQDSPLPAVTFEVDSTSQVALGGLNESQLVVTGIDERTEDAAALEAEIVDALVPGTYSGIKVLSLVPTATRIDKPIVGLSDEQEPATITVNITVHWSN